MFFPKPDPGASQDPDPTRGGPPPASARGWAVWLAGLGLLLLLLSVLWIRPPASDVGHAPSLPVPQISPDKVPLVTGDEPIQQIFIRAGCAVCHTIPGVPDAKGRVGPALVLGTTGPRRLADPAYAGRAGTVREYVIESILDPGRYVVPGFQDRVMPRWYGNKLTAQALDKIAAYLEGITNRDASS